MIEILRFGATFFQEPYHELFKLKERDLLILRVNTLDNPPTAEVSSHLASDEMEQEEHT